MLDIKINPTEVKRKLARLQSSISPASLAAFARLNVALHLQNQAREQFAREGGRLTGPWAPLTPWTQEDRRSQGYSPAHPILHRTGELRDWITNEGVAQATSEVFMWPGTLPPNNSSLHFAYACAQTGRKGNYPHAPRKIAVVGLQDMHLMTDMLQRRIEAFVQ